MTMSKEHCQVLEECRVELVKDLEPDDVLDYLIADKILVPDDVEQIKSMKTRKERARCLLDLLPRRGKDAIGSFMKALDDHDSGHHHLYKLINEKLCTCQQAQDLDKENYDPTVPILKPRRAAPRVAKGEKLEDVECPQVTPVPSPAEGKRRTPPPRPQPPRRQIKSDGWDPGKKGRVDKTKSLPTKITYSALRSAELDATTEETYTAQPSNRQEKGKTCKNVQSSKMSPSQKSASFTSTPGKRRTTPPPRPPPPSHLPSRHSSRVSSEPGNVQGVRSVDPEVKDSTHSIGEPRPDANLKKRERNTPTRDMAASYAQPSRTTDTSASGGKDERKRIKKEDIGSPAEFRHLAHFDGNPDKAFGIDNINVNFKTCVNCTGDAEGDTKDVDTAHCKDASASNNQASRPVINQRKHVKKKDIGDPEDFEHITHVDYDPTKAFGIDQMDSEAKACIQSMGLDPTAMDTDTAHYHGDADENFERSTSSTDLAADNIQAPASTVRTSASGRED